METLQNLVAIAIEGTAILGLFLIVDGLVDAVIECWRRSGKRVQLAVEEPTVEEPVVEEPVVEEPVVEEPVVEEPVVEEPVVEEPVVEEPVVEEPSPILSRYEAMNVKQLRQECQVHCIDWRKGGDYGKPMKRNQMIRSLTA